MIVTWGELPALANQVVMVDGSFDPLHEGHVAYFAAAKRLGKPVLCNIAPDSWTAQKHPVLLSQDNRAAVIDAIRFVSYVHCSSRTTRDVIKHLRPVAYVKGADWLNRGGIPDEEKKLCDTLGVEVKYVDTVLNSSTRLIDRVRNA
jgi:cytidyltransferase-like protein